MKKKTAAIIALVGALFYLLVSIYLMFKYDVDPEVALEGEYFLTFLLLRLPKIVFLFTCAIYFLVAIPQNTTQNAPKARVVKYVEEYEDEDEEGNVVVSRVVRNVGNNQTQTVAPKTTKTATTKTTTPKTTTKPKTSTTKPKTTTSKQRTTKTTTKVDDNADEKVE